MRRGVCASLSAETRAADLFAVGYWDADLSTPLSTVQDFSVMLEEQPQAVAVIGSRIRLMGRQVERKPLRHYSGRIFATLASGALGFPVYDTQCGAKLFRVTEQLHGLFHPSFMTRWAFDVELLARLRRAYGTDMGARGVVVEYPVQKWKDVEGSKVRLSHLPRMVADLARIRTFYR